MRAKNRIIQLLLLILVVSSINLPRSFADKRNYVWTYQYKTLKQGESEAETYFTLSTPDMKNMDTTIGVEHKFELEFGMTDRFDFGIYQIFGQEPGDNLRYKGFQFRGRYRLSEKNKFIFDPLLYLEYKGTPNLSSHGIEFKFIMAKDINRFNFALNPVIEFEYEHAWETKTGYAFGMNYRLARLLHFGVEAKGSENGHYLGPVLSHGNSDFWVALGSAFSVSTISAGAPEFQLRMLLGIEF